MRPFYIVNDIPPTMEARQRAKCLTDLAEVMLAQPSGLGRAMLLST